MTAARRPPLFAFAALLPFVAIALSYLDYIPIWDAREYAECIARAAHPGSHFPSDYGCSQHPTVAYVAIVSLLSQVLHDRYWPILLMNIALGAFALYQFLQLARELFPEDELGTGLLTLILSASPLFLASGVSVNPDFGVTAFFIALIRALLRERFWQATAFAVLLTFCKEPGILLALAAIGLHALLFGLRGPDRLRALARHVPLLLCAPLLLLWLRLGPHTSDQALWKGNTAGGVLQMLVSFSPLDPLFLAQLACIFVLQFSWLYALALFLRWLGSGVDALMRRPATLPRALVFLDLLFLAAVYLLTRPRTFLNARYFLPLAPLLLLVFYVSLRKVPVAARAAALGLCAALSLASAFRAIDPVSRTLFGTFDFGEHAMLQMTSLDHECCGHGRDQLAYNLQHTQFHDLQDALFAMMTPADLHGLAVDLAADWWLVGSLDGEGRRALPGEATWTPHLFTAEELSQLPAGAPLPDRLWWIEFPNLPGGSGFARLSKRYVPVREIRAARSGYALVATEVKLRAP